MKVNKIQCLDCGTILICKTEDDSVSCNAPCSLTNTGLEEPVRFWPGLHDIKAEEKFIILEGK